MTVEAWLNRAKEAIERNSATKWPDCKVNWQSIEWKQTKKHFIVWSFYIERPDIGSAYCFIDHDGNIYKTAGWGKPAKGIRGTIETVDQDNLDGSTGWLYR